MKLKNKVAIITGGGSGIGEATAKLFASEGAKVVVADMKKDAADAVAGAIRDVGGEAISIELDVRSKSAVESAVKQTLEKFGAINILVNNAGITKDAFAKKMSEEDWDIVIDVNLKGAFLCSQAVIPHISEGGRILNTSSIGVLGNLGQSNYAASKMGIIGLTRTLALELAKNRVCVNAIAPGATETAMFKGVPDKVREFIISKIPLGRLAAPEEIAKAHLFLASDDAAFITGQCIFVDGGMSVGI
jgi:3-oxoacyl-[acyl-carrier protein] reductase